MNKFLIFLKQVIEIIIELGTLALICLMVFAYATTAIGMISLVTWQGALTAALISSALWFWMKRKKMEGTKK